MVPRFFSGFKGNQQANHSTRSNPLCAPRKNQLTRQTQSTRRTDKACKPSREGYGDTGAQYVKARNEVNESCHKSRWIDHLDLMQANLFKQTWMFSTGRLWVFKTQNLVRTWPTQNPCTTRHPSLFGIPLLTFIYQGLDCGSSEEACPFLGVFGTPVLAVGVRSEDGSSAWNG